MTKTKRYLVKRLNMSNSARKTHQNDIETIRSELKVMEGLCSCGDDDAHVWAAQEALKRLEAALCPKKQ